MDYVGVGKRSALERQLSSPTPGRHLSGDSSLQGSLANFNRSGRHTSGDQVAKVSYYMLSSQWADFLFNFILAFRCGNELHLLYLLNRLLNALS